LSFVAVSRRELAACALLESRNMPEHPVNTVPVPGMSFAIVGVVSDIRTQEAKPPQVGVVAWLGVIGMGFNEQFRLAESAHASKLKRGDSVELSAECRKFKESTYPGAARVVAVNGKPFAS
jgi:hypothetical protein